MNLSFSANFGTPGTSAKPTGIGNKNDVPSSKFFDRLGSVPSISSGIEAVKTNPITAAPLQITQRTSSLFAAPVFPLASLSYFVLEPLIQPIIDKVDTLASELVDQVESTVPLITEEPGKIMSEVKHLIFIPVNKFLEEKDYVLETYSQECSSHGNRGALAKGRAVICTQLIVVSDGLLWLKSILSGVQRPEKPSVVQNRRYL
ncbi:MAG: hypothetical protein LQ352_005223 [Teloschistes flavicans]|nr:MAG: hypothetical protein LQ352_005223 [Teloschistes flavicans]